MGINLSAEPLATIFRKWKLIIETQRLSSESGTEAWAGCGKRKLLIISIETFFQSLLGQIQPLIVSVSLSHLCCMLWKQCKARQIDSA